jgi:hypothetical protein
VVKSLLGRLVPYLRGKDGVRSRRTEGPAPSSGDGELTRRKLRTTNRRLRQRLEEKDRELERLRTRLVEGATRGPKSLQEVPVFFVVGRTKSGTSWVMKILDAHPEILCKGEGRFFGRDFIQEDFERGQQGRIQPSSLYRALLEAEYLEGWIERSVWTRGDDVGEHLANLTRLSTGYFLAQRLAKSGKKIVGDKTPLSSPDVLEEISSIYPEAKVIHVIRDGRDAAVSLVHHRWNHATQEGGIYELKPEELRKRQAYRDNPEKLVEAGVGIFPDGMLENLAVDWKHRTSKAMQDGRALLGERYAEVRYEDLLERSEEEVRRLLEFLGADASEETVRRCVDSARFESLSQGRERGEEDSSSFFRKGIAGDWRTVFTEEDRRIFKEAAGEMLVELGYEKDHGW